MKKKYLPLIALLAGFVWAFIAAGIHSMFFTLLPFLSFAFGYFSSWWRGLLNGLLLFLGYTFATALMWFGFGINLIFPLQYFYAFMFGGFSLLLVGALAPLVRRGFKKIGSIAALAVVAFLMVWCGFQAWPAYSCYYQAIVHTTSDPDYLELSLPAAIVDGDVYEEIYDSPLGEPMFQLTSEYSREWVDTEHGQMLKLTLTDLMNQGPPGYPYTGNIIFWQPGLSDNNFREFIMPWQKQSAPHQLIRLMPRYEVVPVNKVESQQHIGLTKVSESIIVEEFKVPIMVKSDKPVDFELRMENRTSYGGWINFTYSRSKTFTELIRYNGSTGDEWQLVPVEVTDRLSIRGVGN